jgi:hypothetical protein
VSGQQGLRRPRLTEWRPPAHPRARAPGSGKEDRVRRAARGLTPLKMVGTGVDARRMHGVAQHARGPESRRTVSTSDRRWRAACWLPGHGRPQRLVAFSDTGLAFALTMRERQGAARERHALSRIRKTARHRPVSTPAPAAGRRWPAQGTGISPVAGQAPAQEGQGICQRSNAGALPPPSTCRTLRQLRKAFLPPGPKRLRSIRRRERDECGMGARGVENLGCSVARISRRATSPPWWGRMRISAP